MSKIFNNIKNIIQSNYDYIFIIVSCIFLHLLFFGKPISYIVSFFVGIAFIILLFKDLKYGVGGFLLIGCYPNLLSRSMFDIYALNPINIIFLTMFVLYIFKWCTGLTEYHNGKYPLKSLIVILFFTQILWTFRLISEDSYYAGARMAMMQELIKPLQYYIYFYLLYRLANSINSIKFYFYCLFVGLMIGVLVLFWNYIVLGYHPESPRMWSGIGLAHKQYFSILVAIECLICISLFIYADNNYKRILFSFFGIVSLTVLIYSYSRTTWVAFTLGLIYIIFKLRIKYIFLLIPTIIIGAFILFNYSPLFAERIKGFWMMADPRFFYLPYTRIESILAGIKGIQSDPIFGGGFKWVAFGHNGYLVTWNKLGIVGFVTSIIIFFKMFKVFSKKINFSGNSSITNTIALTGASIITMVPIINITASFQLTDPLDMPAVMAIMTLFMCFTKITIIEKHPSYE